MSVPTHKANCRKLFCRPSYCSGCGRRVFHWACTCGSSVLFDSLGDPWPKHECKRMPSNVQGSKLKKRSTYSLLSVECSRCGSLVRKQELDAHLYWSHGIGERPDDPVKQSSGSRKSAKLKNNKPSKRLMVVCEICNQKVRQARLEKHMRKAHSSLPSPGSSKVQRRVGQVESKLPNGTTTTKLITKCKICSTPVRLDRLEGHMKRAHSV